MSRAGRRGTIASARRRAAVAPVFVAAARAGNGITAQTASLTIVVPAGAAATQSAILFAQSETLTTLATPSGWSLFRTDDVSTTTRTWIFTKTLVGGDPGANVTLTYGAANRPTADMLVFSGGNLAGLLSNVLTQTTATTTMTLPTVAGAPVNAMVIAAWLRRRSGAAGVITVPAPYTSPVNGDTATAFAAGANTYIDTGYATTTGGTVGGEDGTTGTSNVGNDYVLVLPGV